MPLYSKISFQSNDVRMSHRAFRGPGQRAKQYAQKAGPDRVKVWQNIKIMPLTFIENVSYSSEKFLSSSLAARLSDIDLHWTIG